VPVHHLSSDDRKAYIHLPIKKGDLGMAVFCERSIDKWLSGEGQIVSPEDPRHHSLSDAFFIPGVLPFSQAIQGLNGNDLTIANDQIKITLYPEGKVSIEGATQEFLDIVDSILDHLISAKVLATSGSEPGVPFSSSTIANFTQDKIDLATLKK